MHFVCLKSFCMTNTAKRHWLPRIKSTAHSRQDCVIILASKACGHNNMTEIQGQFWEVYNTHHAGRVLDSSTKQTKDLTFIVASSEAETMTLKTGWKMTLVTGLLWPLRAYFSGGRGIHSLGSRFCPIGPPILISSFASFSFDSNSIT